MQKSKCTLIIDTRERNILRHEETLNKINTIIKQITIGDYVIISPTGTPYAVIERKSLDDYGASLKDGRHNNKQKLIQFRNTTGARIIYLIEGPAHPSLDECFGGIPYQYILNSILRLIGRDGFNILFTKNTIHSAELLVNFTLAMDNMQEEEYIDIKTDIQNNTEDVINILTKRQDKTDIEIARELWACFKGITIKSADEFIKIWSVADIILGNIDLVQLESFKLANGRRLGKNIINNLTKIDKLTEIRLLSVIPGISRDTAIDILSTNTITEILTNNNLNEIKIGKSKRSLGIEKSARINRIFEYKLIN